MQYWKGMDKGHTEPGKGSKIHVNQQNLKVCVTVTQVKIFTEKLSIWKSMLATSVMWLQLRTFRKYHRRTYCKEQLLLSDLYGKYLMLTHKDKNTWTKY